MMWRSWLKMCIRDRYMIPIITIVCVVGSYSSSYSMYGVLIMFLSGIDVYKRQGEAGLDDAGHIFADPAAVLPYLQGIGR